MLLSTSSRLRQGPTHVTDTGRCPTPRPNPTEVARLRQLSLCCSRSGMSPSSWACSVLFPALRLSHAAVCAATKLLVRCSQDPSDLRTFSVLHPDWRGEPVVTQMAIICSTMNHINYSGDMSTMISGLVFRSPVATDETNRQPNWTATDLDRTAVAHPGGHVIRLVAVAVTQAKLKDRLQPVFCATSSS